MTDRVTRLENSNYVAILTLALYWSLVSTTALEMELPARVG